MNSPGLRRLLSHTDMLAAVAVVLVVTMLVVPLPSELLSLMITLNIAGALTIVVATMYLSKALDFASFPSLLLLTTMFRLAINVSVTRLVLTTGDAGSVVKSLGGNFDGGVLTNMPGGYFQFADNNPLPSYNSVSGAPLATVQV